MEQSSKIKQNIAIYAVGSLTLSIIGGIITAGGLVFIIGLAFALQEREKD